MRPSLNTMQLSQESADKHSIEAYTNQEVKIASQLYRHSLIISSQEIISDWPLSSIGQLAGQTLEPLLRYRPKIILIGHAQPGQLAPVQTIQSLAKQSIGLETMSIG